jgi:EmrB/QacA subfamily drug resistance transporter
MSESTAQKAPSETKIDSGYILLLCSGATFMAFLDLSVVNIAFPSILQHFRGTSIDTLTWIVSGYAVIFAALLTPAGRVADTVGRTNVFLISLLGFTVASLVCGAAPTVGWLIAARLVQGGMAAGMIPAALGLILSTTPRERIPKALGAWSAAAGFSAVVGPAVGGVLVEAFGWRSVFVINGPVGLVLLVLAFRALPRHLPPSGTRMPDLLGTVAVALGIGGVVTALTEGEGWGWGSVKTIGMLLVGFLLAVGAWMRSRRHPAPSIDVTLWASRKYAMCNVASAIVGVAMFAWLLGAPLYTATIWHWSILESAGALMIGAVAAMIGSTLAGNVKKPGMQRWTAVIGILMFAASNAIWASDLFGSEPHFWIAWVPAGILGGAGLGSSLTALSSAAAIAVPPMKFASAVGMNLTARQVGGAVGTAMLAAIMASNAVPGSINAFHNVYGASMVIAVLAAIAALGVTDPKPVTQPTDGVTATATS